MNINIETNTVLNVTSDELDVIARELCGVKLSLADSGVPTYLVQSVSTNGITALTSDGVHSDTQNALLNIGITVLTAITYLRILDPEVRDILSTFFNGQTGLPIIYTTVSTSSNTGFKDIFQNNTNIVNFDEFKYFSWYNNNGYFSFQGCSNLKSIDLSNTKNFPGKFISGCGSLEYFYGTGSTKGELIIQGDSIINSESFDQYSYGYGRNIYITKLIFLEGITYIPARFIRDVYNLTEVSIPSTCSNVYSQAFYGCYNVLKVNISDLNAWVNISFSDASSPPIREEGSAKLYLNGQIVTDYTYPEGTAEVKNYTWQGNSGLEYIILPQTITSIGINAFSNCTNLVLNDINLPNLTYLGSGAFAATKIKTVTDLGSITIIKLKTFRNCNELTSVNIPNTVTTLEADSFNGCSALTTININDITTLGNTVFYGNSNLEYFGGPNSTAGELNLPNLTSLGTGAFLECKKITSVASLGNTITTLPAYCFCNCTNLASISIPNTVTKINNNALYYTGLSGTLTISDNVTEIGMDCIRLCPNITSIIIGTGITKFGIRAIFQCNSLLSVTVKATTPPTYGSLTFTSCGNLLHIYVPSASVATYKSASGWSSFSSIIEAIPS